jgi:uroporphyrinogen decarboxylase
MLTVRENYLRNARFQKPEWIPCNIVINDASWDMYQDDMESVCIRFPEFFPRVKPGWRNYANYDFGPAYRKNEPFTDAWGSVWETATNGIEGIVKNEVLDNWDKLDHYRVPNAETQLDRSPVDWREVARTIKQSKDKGELTIGSVAHGFLFLRILYLRGFMNAMIDFAADDPHLPLLIDMIVEHNMTIVQHYLEMGVDQMCFADDLGTQTSIILSPDMLRKYIFPAYKKLMDPCKKAGTLVYLHSDGRTLDILEEQARAGVDIVNPQDLCNGIDNIARTIKGKACIELDIDRQTVIPYGNAHDIDSLINEEVIKLGSEAGGLQFIAGIYPPTPPRNVEALCKALLKYRRHWWE